MRTRLAALLLLAGLPTAAAAQVFVFADPRDGTYRSVTVHSTQQSCDPAYPSRCIPPSPPDLDCDEVGYRRFDVGARDPHGFDRDRDGIGCE